MRTFYPVGDKEQSKDFKQETEMRKSACQNELSESNVEEQCEGLSPEGDQFLKESA